MIYGKQSQKRIIHVYLQNRMLVRVNLSPVMTKKFVSLTTKVEASNVTVTVVTLGNLAVSIMQFNVEFKSERKKTLLVFFRPKKLLPLA